MNACYKGRQALCDLYYNNDRVSCKKCLPSFFVMEIFKEIDTCLPYNTFLNAEFGSEFFAENRLNVKSVNCNNSYDYLKISLDASAQQSRCVALDSPNCKIVNSNTYFQYKLIKCDLCNDGYFINENCSCVKRKVIYKCVEYLKYADACKVCDNRYYSDNSTGLCTSNPSGIRNCEVYSSTTTCKLCKPLHILREGYCEKVTREVKNCSYYIDEKICNQCEKGYFLMNRMCLEVIAVNCLSYI